jgi:hypothetical protein
MRELDDDIARVYAMLVTMAPFRVLDAARAVADEVNRLLDSRAQLRESAV